MGSVVPFVVVLLAVEGVFAPLASFVVCCFAFPVRSPRGSVREYVTTLGRLFILPSILGVGKVPRGGVGIFVACVAGLVYSILLAAASAAAAGRARGVASEAALARAEVTGVR